MASSLSIPEHCHPTKYEENWSHNVIDDVKRDFSVYFRKDNFSMFVESLVAAGIFANTGLDRSINRHWQEDIHSNSSGTSTLSIPKAFGDFSYAYPPLYLILMGVGHMREHTLLGNVMYTWAYRGLRASFLGGIQQVFLTHALGSGRPIRHEDSKWQPFRYNNGVSGHAFYGAIPFITAAQMTDLDLPRFALYAFAFLPGLSRIDTQSHYFSQVLLGWTLALLSTHSVYVSDSERRPPFQFSVTPKSDGAMLNALYSF